MTTTTVLVLNIQKNEYIGRLHTQKGMTEKEFASNSDPN